ncbi:MAG: hypothetical protein BroJett040_07090 [Oligoflexia bacterium]|nr:MAG: hypothetical protein BroJett040_07090 [Oligoflexia bacterium]
MTFSVGKISHEWSKGSRLQAIYQETIPSTNDLGKELALTSLSQYPISLILTDDQTAGRGRGKNSWTNSQPGTSLLSTWVFQLSSPPQPVTTCRTGLAVRNALLQTWPWLPLSLKAPNDLYLQTKKLGGLLTETITQGSKQALIIGLGINVWKNPHLEIADCLKSFVNESCLTEEDWNSFLDRLLLELSLAVSASNDLLSDRERQSLLLALNQKPDLDEKYIDISPEGTLKTKSKEIHWFEL